MLCIAVYCHCRMICSIPKLRKRKRNHFTLNQVCCVTCDLGLSTLHHLEESSSEEEESSSSFYSSVGSSEEGSGSETS